MIFTIITKDLQKELKSNMPQIMILLKKQPAIAYKKIGDIGKEVGKKLAFVLSGGNTTIEKELSEDDLYALELESFIQLIQMEKTQARIKHTLTTGKSLVN